uniref:Uncharacterized protein n=1 Tax=Mus musculus TaxID=10090 RepID=Q3UTN8_MOUSE|nr:unnamed protein product [Mus musculus]
MNLGFPQYCWLGTLFVTFYRITWWQFISYFSQMSFFSFPSWNWEGIGEIIVPFCVHLFEDGYFSALCPNWNVIAFGFIPGASMMAKGNHLDQFPEFMCCLSFSLRNGGVVEEKLGQGLA